MSAATWVRCDDCGAGFYPAQRHCTACGAWERMRVVPLPRRGRLFTWTTIHVAAADPPLPPPFALALVDLDDGPRVMAPIVLDGDPDRDLRSGMALRLVEHAGAVDDARPGFHLEVD
ncbi:Zn-ribbon domain-containing OB-fold protein [Patulibacter defluvii]|uniref:Zn-ribbon domain-containing OB-fold protein n=1 Tax=Patulibacter defluvii TaxID=3095358 RepID=UPI002A74E6A1|nr:OB-fold domain-containing protein [Patulibacter sp. DM4]